MFDVDDIDLAITEIINNRVPDILIISLNESIQTFITRSSKKLSRIVKHTKVLLLTAPGEVYSVLTLVKAGIKGVLSRDRDVDALIEAVRSISLQGTYLPKELYTHLVNEISDSRHCEMEEVSLTVKEKRFLYLLCQEYSYKEIGERMFLSHRTIDDYRKKLTKKVKAKGRSGLIVFAMELGLHHEFQHNP